MSRADAPRTNQHGQPVGEPLDWEVAPQPVPVELTGRYVTVTGLEHEHALDLFAAFCSADDDALWTYRPAERPPTVSAMDTLVAGLLAHPSDVTFVISPAAAAPRASRR